MGKLQHGKLERVQVVFMDESGEKTDEVCVRMDVFRTDNPNAPLLLQSFFREALLVSREDGTRLRL
jgi:hypothetical protein